MSLHSSKGNQIHPNAIQNKDAKNGVKRVRRLSLLTPKSQAAKEIDTTLSKNAKLEKEFYECFSTPEQRRTFIRSTRFLEKQLVDFANKSTMVPRETLHFSREFIRGVRSYLEDDLVEDATAKEDKDFEESNSEKVKVKKREKGDDDSLNNITFAKKRKKHSKKRKKHSFVEQLAQRETSEIKFTFKRVITSNHEPYEVVTKDTIGKWLIGEKWAKMLLDSQKGWYYLAWFLDFIAAFVIGILFLMKSIPDTHDLLLLVPSLFFFAYGSVMISSINILLFKKLLQEFMFWYTSLSFIVGASVASVAFGGAQRIVLLSFIPIGIVITISDPMPRSVVKSSWSGYIGVIVVSIVIIIALKQLPNNPKLNIHIPVLGTYNWTGVAITALSNYIIMITKLFVVSVWDSKRFVILKVPLQSTKMMENRAEMILVTAEKEKLYKKMGEDGQKLITAIVGSPSDLPWELDRKTSKSVAFTRCRVDEKHGITNALEAKMEIYTKQTLLQAYRQLHKSDYYEVIHEENIDGANFNPALPSMRILYRRIKVPFPGVSDRLMCVKLQSRYFPEHDFAFTTSQDAERKYWERIPKEEKEGTIEVKIRFAGYFLEKLTSRRPMVKVSYFVSSDVGGWMPVAVRNQIIHGETKRVEKSWDKHKWNGEGPALYSTEEVIENMIDESEGSMVGSKSIQGTYLARTTSGFSPTGPKRALTIMPSSRNQLPKTR
eukprot:g2231.t1